MDNRIQRYSVLGVIALCTLVCIILGDSLLGVWNVELGEPIPGGWAWLLGDTEQSFRTQTFALLAGVLLMGIALGGVWFFLAGGIRWVRRQLR